MPRGRRTGTCVRSLSSTKRSRPHLLLRLSFPVPKWLFYFFPTFLENSWPELEVNDEGPDAVLKNLPH